jgi:hypothetical protein
MFGMSGSSDRPPTKTRIRARLSTSVPADPRVPAVTVKRPHPGRGGGGDGGAARKSTARTEEPTMAAGCNPAVETRTGSAAFEGGPKTARPTLRSLDRTRWPIPGRSQRPHCESRQLLPFRGWGLAMVVDLWNVAVEQRSWGVGFGAESPKGCHISTNQSQQGLDVWGVRQRHCTDGVRMDRSLSSTRT